MILLILKIIGHIALSILGGAVFYGIGISQRGHSGYGDIADKTISVIFGVCCFLAIGAFIWLK